MQINGGKSAKRFISENERDGQGVSVQATG